VQGDFSPVSGAAIPGSLGVFSQEVVGVFI